jgi:2-iminobutanoate/2-iminopropanoate deaminase
MKRYIVERIFKPTGPYVHATESHDLIFVSGILGAKQDETLPDDVDVQLEQLFNNISAILDELGLQKSAVMKATVFLKDMAYSAKFNEVYAAFFGEERPARCM